MKRDWWVYSTATEDHSLLVEDRNSGDRGYVPTPTEEEWAAAYHAPSNPLPWRDGKRVVVDSDTAPAFSEEMKAAALEMARRCCQAD